MSEVMHNLLGKYFSGHASEEEEQAVMEWRNSSQDNASEFELLQRIWNGFDQEPVLLFDTQAAWVKVNESISRQRPKARVISFNRIFTAAAAVLVLALGIWWITKMNSNEMVTFTAASEGERIQLEDGSIVYLRKGASLNFPEQFKKDDRSVKLEGEAFFEVVKDPARPFLIHAGEADVQVLGTSFTLAAQAKEVELVVKTGKVQFSDRRYQNRKTVVQAGEKALLKEDGIVKERNSDPNFNAWQTRLLIFSDTPLETVARTLSDFYQVNITIRPQDAAQIAGKGVTIEFRDQTLENVLKELEMITTYSISKKGIDHFEIGIN